MPDLVLSNVVVPAQVIAGSTFNVSYTVTNLGAGPTLVNTWTDSVWLSVNKTRPIPAEGDILLTQFTHTGSLDVKAGYDQTVSVTLPLGLQPGTYYVTPWTDLYSAVLQDTLAINVNPDDPNNLYSDNYKAAQVAILAPLPDLIVTSVTAPAKAQGGDNFTVNWTVKDDGNGVAGPTGWIDTVYLTNDPTNPLDPNAITMTLGSVEHDAMLNPDATYGASLTVELSPSAVGQSIVVYTDAPQPNLMTPVNLVTESDEDNNLGSTNTDVTPVPADLVVTNVSIPKTNYSGESMTFSYTVTNEGPDQVWAGTQYWTDFIWLSTDTTFVRTRASFLGQTTHEQDGPLQPGASYTVSYTVTLPPGTGGQYYLYIDLDAHNDLPPALYTYTARLETTDWWPADTGDNSYWLGEFAMWAFEDPDNNRIATPMTIIYSEPDLKVTNITVPSGVVSGTTIPITYTVTNQGTRATRTADWTDAIFLSQDASLDTGDTELGTAGYGQVLAARASYTETVNVRVPDGIQGTFDILVYADSDASTNYESQSDIGYGLYGIAIGPTNELDPYDLVSSAIRSLGRGHVPQYENEADKLAARPDARDPGPVARLAGDRHQHRRERGPRRAGPDARRHLHRHQRRRRHAADRVDLGRPDLLLGRHHPRAEDRHLPGDDDAQERPGGRRQLHGHDPGPGAHQPGRSLLPVRDHRPAHRQPHRQGVRGRRRRRGQQQPVSRPAADHRPAAALQPGRHRHHPARPGDRRSRATR